jgi:hypothetical protein
MDYTPSPAPDKPPALVSYAPADGWKPVSVPPVSVSTPAPDPFPPGGYWRSDPVYGSVYVHPTPGAGTPGTVPAAPGVVAPVPFAPPPGPPPGGLTSTINAISVVGPSPGYQAPGRLREVTGTRAYAGTRGSISGCST